MANVDLREYVSIWYELLELFSDSLYGSLTFSRIMIFYWLENNAQHKEL